MSDNDDDPYASVGSGGLRLKGDKNKSKKKKKKKSKKNTAEKILDHANNSAKNLEADNSDEEPSTSEAPIKKTAAELAFEKAQEKRAAQRILEKASKTHKQRVEELNEYLGGLSEHYDIQKVSWTK